MDIHAITQEPIGFYLKVNLLIISVETWTFNFLRSINQPGNVNVLDGLDKIEIPLAIDLSTNLSLLHMSHILLKVLKPRIINMLSLRLTK